MKELKHFLTNKLILFFMLTTLITCAIYVLGHLFDRNAQFGYDALLSPLVYAFFCVLPTLVTYSRKELGTKEMGLRMVLEFVLIEGVILLFAFTSENIDTSRPEVVAALAASVLIIYVLVCLFSWLKGSVESMKMNQDLIVFQQRAAEKEAAEH